MRCCQHIRPFGRLASLLAVLALVVACFAGAAGGTAQAATTPGNAALSWAEANALGHPYVWGGTGPSYDCSGLVVAAYAHEGIDLPHNTAAMVDSGLLVRTSNPQRGDLAFWGPISAPYHVGFVTDWTGTAFGALQTGTPIGWYSWQYWPPSAFYQPR